MIPGDLFDPDIPPFSLIEFVRSEFERYLSSGGHIFLLPGNHDHWLCDALPVTRGLNELPNLHLFNKPDMTCRSCRIDQQQLYVYGQPFLKEEQFASPLRNLTKQSDDGFHVALVHGSYKSITGSDLIETEFYHPVSDADIDATQLDFVALGHYHLFVKCQSKIPAYYSGSPEGLRLSLKEEGSHCCLFITIDEQKQIEVTQIKTNQKQIKLLDVDLSLKDMAAVRQELRRLADENMLLSIKLRGIAQSISDLVDIANLREQFRTLFFHLQINDKEVNCADRLLQNVNKHTAEGLFLQIMTRYIDRTSNPEEKNLWSDALLTGLAEIK